MAGREECLGIEGRFKRGEGVEFLMLIPKLHGLDAEPVWRKASRQQAFIQEMICRERFGVFSRQISIVND